MRELTYEITPNCPLFCIQCSTRASADQDYMLDLEKFKKNILKFNRFDVVRLSGGEPFMHPNIKEMLQFLKEQNKKTIVLTSGILEKGKTIDNYLIEDNEPKHSRFGFVGSRYLDLIKDYVNELVFSVHGPEDVHDSIVKPVCIEENKVYDLEQQKRYYPFEHDFVYEAMSSADHVGIYHSVQTVLMRNNFNHLDELADDLMSYAGISKFSYRNFRKKFGKPFNWHILRLVNQGRCSDNSNQILSGEELKQFNEKINEYNSEIQRRESIYEISSSMIITQTKSFNQEQKCNCGSEKLVITQDGKIIPCSALKYGADRGKNYACENRI